MTGNGWETMSRAELEVYMASMLAAASVLARVLEPKDGDDLASVVVDMVALTLGLAELAKERQ